MSDKSDKQKERLQLQVIRCKTMVRDRLGDGVWGLGTEVDKFTHEEIVFLFARIFQALGFEYVKKVRTGYPDCLCVKDKREVGVEFEPVLSSFKEHITKKDDLAKCQFIVCWKDDTSPHDSITTEIRAANIEVIELRSIFEEGKITDRFASTVITKDDFRRLTKNQLLVLRVFVQQDKVILTRSEISKGIDLTGQALGGALKGFTELSKKRIDWLLRQRPGHKEEREWEINRKHWDMVIKTLKEYGMV